MKTIECQIERISHEGRGIGHHDDKTAFVTAALPGERVNYRVIGKRKKLMEGVCVDVLDNPSKDRVDARCAHFGHCGGCSLQHWRHECQIEHKQAVLIEKMSLVGEMKADEIAAPLVADIWQYRRRARLSVKYVDKKEKVVVGFREFQSRYVADISRCDILAAPLGDLITPLAELIGQLTIKRAIPQIECAVGSDGTALVFRHMEPVPESDKKQLIEFAKERNIMLFLQEKDPYALEKIWPADEVHYLHYDLPSHGLSLQFHPCDFIQINGAINDMMVTQACDWLELDSSDVVLDAFCGGGNFSLALARRAKKVFGIEGDIRLVMTAKHNAAANQLDANTSFHVEDCYQLQANTQYSWLSETCNKWLIDPPRSGAQAFLESLSAQLPDRLVYVSCNMDTLVKDAAWLKTQGYRLSKLGVMDMFPHTTHVECMACFVR